MQVLYDSIIAWTKSNKVQSIGRWGIKGGVAVLDQGLFSGSNFVLNILLARWMSPADYGAFAIAFAVYLFVSGFHNAIILEPMSVFGTSKYSDNLKNYILTQFAIHGVVSVFISVFALLFGYVLFTLQLINGLVYHGLIAVSVFLPLMLLMWVVRRACYMLSRAFWAVIGSLIYSFALLGGIVLIFYDKPDSGLFLLFAVIGVASLIGSIVVIGLIWFMYFSFNDKRLSWLELITEQMVFGRWIVLATFFHFLGSQAQIFIAASMLGLEIVGAFRAAQNLVLPMFQVLAAVTTMIFPSIAFEYGQNNYVAVWRKSMRFAVVLVLMSLLYEAMLLLGSGWIVRTIYNDRYSEYIWLIPLMGLTPILNALVGGFSLILRSLQKPHFYLINKTLFAIVGSLSAFFFIKNLSVAGAVFSLILVEVTDLFMHWFLYQRWFVSLVRPNQLDNNKLSI